MNKEVLLMNIDKIHTTEMGIDRIKKNLKLDINNVVDYCKNKILGKNCIIYKLLNLIEICLNFNIKKLILLII